MRWRALLLIFVMTFTSGIVCAIVCPDDIFESHNSDCEQCISTDFVVSSKISDDSDAIPDVFAIVRIDLTNLPRPRECVEMPRPVATPLFHHARFLALRV